MMNDMRPVAEIYLVHALAKDIHAAVAELRTLGFAVAGQYSGWNSVTFFVSKDSVLAKEATRTTDQRRFGELMGFPTTAIDAFIAHGELMSHEELQELVGFELGEMFMHVKFAKAHPNDAVEYVRKSMKILLEQAPQLLEEMLPRGIDPREHKEKVTRFVYADDALQKN